MWIVYVDDAIVFASPTQREAEEYATMLQHHGATDVRVEQE